MNKKIEKIAVSGIMVALGTILSLITVFRLPYGGSVTAFSMVPVMLTGFMYGMPWGLLTGLVYGIVQAILGATTSAAFADQNAMGVFLICILDFLIAFAVLGLAGMFKKSIKNPVASFGLGVFVTGLLRYACHFLSGYLVFGEYAEWFFTQKTVTFGQKIMDTFSGKGLAAIYSLIYNGTYMVPEIIISVVIGMILMGIPQIRKFACKGSVTNN